MSIRKRNRNNKISYLVSVYLPEELRIQYGRNYIYKSFNNLKDAQKWERIKKKEVDAGYINFDTVITIADAAQQYIDENTQKWSPTSVRTYKGYIKNYLVPVFKDKPVNSFTPLDMKKFNKSLENMKDKTEKTKHNISSFLRAIMKWAKFNDYIQDGLDDDIAKHSQKPVTIRDYLTMNELKKLLPFLLTSDVREVITFMAFTGMRVSEVCGLRFCDVNFEMKTLTVNHQIFYTKENEKGYKLLPPKCGHVSSIPLNKVAFDVLLNRKAGQYNKNEDFVFSDKLGKPFRHDGRIKFQFANAVNKMKSRKLLDESKHITFHSLRHTYASMLVHLNENIHTVQHLLRHKDFRVTYNTYAHMYPDKKPDSFDKIDKEFDDLI